MKRGGLKELTRGNQCGYNITLGRRQGPAYDF